MLSVPPIPRILIVKLSAIGDCILASPVTRALREKFPQAHIAWVVQSKAFPVVEANPYINSAIVWHGQGLRGLLYAVREVRRARWDILVDLQGADKSALLVGLVNIPVRVVSSRAKACARRCANVIVTVPDPPPHATLQYLTVASVLGCDTRDTRLVMSLHEEDRRFADEFFKEHFAGNSPVVALNPGATRPIKRWPTKNFSLLADALAEDGVQTLIVGGPADVPLANRLLICSRSQPTNAVGKTTLRQLAALLQRCATLVTGDTGPMHVAAAVGTKVVALFGPTDPQRTGPVGEGHIVLTQHLPCRPCLQKPTCARIECMTDLAVDVVLCAVRESLAA